VLYLTIAATCCSDFFEMNSFREIIAAYGAPNLAKILGVPRTHVHVMRLRNSIPPAYWRVLVEAPAPGGMPPVTFSMLGELAASKGAQDRNGHMDAAE
jgi:hypothetical protein